MREIVDALRGAEREMATERGPFLLLALFLREDAPDRWDVVVSAPWVEQDRAGALRYISSKLGESLAEAQLTQISRVVLVDPSHPAMKSLQSTVSVTDGGLLEIKGSVFFGLEIRHAYFITAQRLAA